MDDTDHLDLLADRFEQNRPHLTAVARRMLGSATEADDAVQEAWLRLSRSDAAAIDNLAGWLTTVVGRVCLDMLRSRTTRREDPLELTATPVGSADPERDAVVADSVGTALLVVLETLSPAERLAFVLHDLFGVPFSEIAAIVGCWPVAARQHASRARRRVRGADPDRDTDRQRQREVVEAFLAASRSGDFEALLRMLAPDVVLRADAAAAAMGADPEVHGPRLVAETFRGRARAALLALVDGAAGAVWSMGGTPKVVFAFTVAGDRVTGIDLLADPERIAALDLEPLA
jgi:RNA polymerase sigma factor (sigma-70 family)